MQELQGKIICGMLSEAVQIDLDIFIFRAVDHDAAGIRDTKIIRNEWR